jgi:hypothetical protein
MAISNEIFEYYRLIQKAKKIKNEKKEVQTIQKQPRKKSRKNGSDI